MIKVICKLDNYNEPKKEDLILNNHWCDNGKVEIVIKGEVYVVIASDLIKAINNYTNT